MNELLLLFVESDCNDQESDHDTLISAHVNSLFMVNECHVQKIGALTFPLSSDIISCSLNATVKIVIENYQLALYGLILVWIIGELKLHHTHRHTLLIA
jgi:hypothetical protein